MGWAFASGFESGSYAVNQEIGSVMLKRFCIALVGISGMTLWSSAQSMSLQEAARIAIDSNPEVQAARLEEQSRVHEIRFAEAGYYPKVDSLVGIGRENTRDLGDEHTDLTRKEAALTAEQMLFDGHGTREEVNRQKARQRSALYTEAATADDITIRTANAYLTVLRENELTLLAQETEKTHQSIYDQMQLREKSGVGSQADLDQITGRLALANTNVITSQANLLDAATKFQALVGVYPDVGNMQYPDLVLSLPNSLDEAVALAIQTSPALLSAKADVDAGRAQYEASKSPFWPRVTLEAEHSYSDDADGIKGDEDSTLVALRMRYNLYRGGADSARKMQTALLMNEAMEIRNDKQRKITEELRYSWDAIQAIQRQIPYLEQHVTASTATREAYYKQFNIGRRTLLDLLNTENELVDAKRALIRAKYDRLVSEMSLLAGIGNLRPALAVDDAGKKPIEITN